MYVIAYDISLNNSNKENAMTVETLSYTFLPKNKNV